MLWRVIHKRGCGCCLAKFLYSEDGCVPKISTEVGFGQNFFGGVGAARKFEQFSFANQTTTTMALQKFALHFISTKIKNLEAALLAKVEELDTKSDFAGIQQIIQLVDDTQQIVGTVGSAKQNNNITSDTTDQLLKRKRESQESNEDEPSTKKSKIIKENACEKEGATMPIISAKDTANSNNFSNRNNLDSIPSEEAVEDLDALLDTFLSNSGEATNGQSKEEEHCVGCSSEDKSALVTGQRGKKKRSKKEPVTLRILLQNGLLHVGDTIKWQGHKTIVDEHGCIGDPGTEGYGTSPSTWFNYVSSN